MVNSDIVREYLKKIREENDAWLVGLDNLIRKQKERDIKIAQIIDLTDYDMLPFDGYQSFNLEDVERVFKGIKKNLRKDYFIEKDTKPDWWHTDDWKQTWTIRKKPKDLYTTNTTNKCRRKKENGNKD